MNDEKRKIFDSVLVPMIFIVVIWLVKMYEIIFHHDLGEYGLQPLQLRGLIGIITCPFLHGDLAHLTANTLPAFFLMALLFYFYRSLAWPVLFLTWFVTGLWVWLFARGEAVHIGASGIIYGLAAFLFLSGILRRESRLMAITLLTAFLYGGLVWGVFPQFFPQKPISWESHLMGIVAGVVLAVFFRNSGPQRKPYEWEEDEEEGESDDQGNPDVPGEEDSSDPAGRPPLEPPDIRYHYKP